jgi:hypothetical protein
MLGGKRTAFRGYHSAQVRAYIGIERHVKLIKAAGIRP